MLNFQTLIDYGTISAEDVNLFFSTDSVDEAYDYLTKELVADGMPEPGPHL